MKKPATLYRNAAITFSLLLSGTLQAVEVDDQAPSFTLPALGNGGASRSVNLQDFEGKVVYLDFWASWCAPCQISIPLLNELRNRYVRQGLDFEVVAINVDDDASAGTDFLFDVPVNYVVLSDPAGKTPALYAVEGMPTAYLLDRAGKVRLVHSGFKRNDIDMIAREVQKLLAETP